MSSIYFKIGELFKQKETEMVTERTTQVNSDTSTKDTKLAEIEADRLALHNATGAGFMAGERATKVGELSTLRAAKLAAITALVTNATAEVDSIGDLISYLNANDGDWTSTLATKKTDLDNALAAHDLSLGDFANFEAVWGVIYTRSSAAVPSTDLVEHLM